MYKYLNLVLLGTIAQCAHVSADDVDGKMYVRPKQVRMMKDKIIVRTQDGVFEAKSVTLDDNGLFVNQKELVAAAPEMVQRNKAFGGCKRKRFQNNAKEWKQHKHKNKAAWKLNHQQQNNAAP